MFKKRLFYLVSHTSDNKVNTTYCWGLKITATRYNYNISFFISYRKTFTTI